MYNQVMIITEEKKGKKYIETMRSTDVLYVYTELSKRLTSKKLLKCTWIKSISQQCLYNGFRKIIVTYDNGFRDIFIVEY